MRTTIRVTVWNEFLHEQHDPKISAVYPEGIHHAIATSLQNQSRLTVRTATLADPDQGLPDALLHETDVLIWWGHLAHNKVRDVIIEKVYRRIIYDGMSLIVLHSAHYSKIFKRLLGTTCSLKWREAGEKERLWVVAGSHPIAEGIDDYFEIEKAEMYGEPFDIPRPDELVFISWFTGGEVFRSGCCFYRGRGKIFYFRPGHEAYPIYYHPTVLKVINNAVRWGAPITRPQPILGKVKPIEEL